MYTRNKMAIIELYTSSFLSLSLPLSLQVIQYSIYSLPINCIIHTHLRADCLVLSISSLLLSDAIKQTLNKPSRSPCLFFP